MHSKLKLWKSLYIDVSKNSVAVPPFAYISCSLLSNLQVEYWKALKESDWLSELMTSEPLALAGEVHSEGTPGSSIGRRSSEGRDPGLWPASSSSGRSLGTSRLPGLLPRRPCVSRRKQFQILSFRDAITLIFYQCVSVCVVRTAVRLALSLSWINSSMRSEKFGLVLPTSLETGRAFWTTSSLLTRGRYMMMVKDTHIHTRTQRNYERRDEDSQMRTQTGEMLTNI